jgi:hypothetical protein
MESYSSGDWVVTWPVIQAATKALIQLNRSPDHVFSIQLLVREYSN